MDDLIRRSDATALAIKLASSKWKESYIQKVFDELPAVEPKHGENIGTDYAECDQFICSECGIHLQGWVRIDEDDYDDGIVHEYEFRFCPHCGAKMKGEDDEKR